MPAKLHHQPVDRPIYCTSIELHGPTSSLLRRACRWDHLGSNFAVQLRPNKEPAAPGAPKAADKAKLPQALCDTWAWIRWDHAGRPHRSEEQADMEYEAAVAEMSQLLEAGR
jgi:hypothetical protein